MTLAAGSRLGPYEILAPLGAGGMGEVYRAKDTRLDRTVAIKVLPSHLSENAEVRQRFEREAKTISSLSHPHICGLYDVGREDGTDYLVMEFLEGETLTDRLAKGSLPLEQTLRYGIEMADALNKAHRQGVVHRDLKPGNVMLTKSGVKLVDFGLAKFTAPGAARLSSATALPTQTPDLTAEGTILGTFRYMAPEQLEGKEADARADIFALGAVLYEMATGQKAFSGRNQASLIGAILHTQPSPISTIQPMSPPALDRVVKTCLAKDPEERWQTAHDVMLQLKWIAEGGSQAGLPAPVVARRKGREALGWVLAGVLLLFAIAQALMYSRRAPAESRTIRSFVLLPERTVVESISLSPDGRDLAFVASSSDGRILLWVRPMDAHAARPVAGTEGAMFPFWSPDSRFLGFFAEGKLKKVEAVGGPAEALCDATNPRGGTWNRDGVILFSPNAGGGLYRVSSAGGVPTPLTALDPSRRENSHRWPYFLPDGLHFLYYARSSRPENAGIYLGSLDSKETRRLVGAPSNAAYAPPGYLLFDRDGTLMAQAFDVRKLRITGEPFPAAEDVGYDGGTFRTDFAVSDNGVLAYRTSASFHTQLTWFDRKGKSLGSVGPPGGYFNLSLSLDERKLAVSRLASRTGTRDLWMYDLSRGTSSRFTFNPSTELAPCWSPDGGRIAFSSDRDGPFNLYQKLATGSANDELLLSTSAPKYVSHWSADGQYLVYESIDPKTKIDLWVLPLFGDRKPILYLQTGSDESQGQLSPDGRWMTYTSNESGRSEVYVQAFPISGGKWQISTNGAVQPRWRGDGKEIFYLALDRKVMAVTVKADSTFETGAPAELFPTQVTQVFSVRNPYAVTADGQRFLINTRVEEAGSSPIAVVINWHAELKK